MLGTGIRGNTRGISEILGAVLVFSFVIVVAVALVAAGFGVLDDATEEAEQRTGQDTMIQIGDELDSVSSSTVETATTVSLPQGAGQDFDSEPENGTLRIEVETKDSNLSASDIVASDLKTTREYELGTLRHEVEDGPVTVYQGGMLFEREGSLVRILSEPNFDYNNGTLDFSFTDISGIGRAAEGEELYAERNVEKSKQRIAEIERIIAEQRTIGNSTDNPIGYADIYVNMTIETEYPEAWETYAQDRMTETPPYVPRDDNITFMFGPINGSDTDPNFAPDVLYAGNQRAAHLYYNNSLGNISDADDGFNLTDVSSTNGTNINPHKDEYGLAVAHNGSWKIADIPQSNSDSIDDWYDVKGNKYAPSEEPIPPFNKSASETGKSSENEWVFDGEAVVCVVVNDDTVQPNDPPEETIKTVAEGDCGQATVTADADDVPDQSPYFDVRNLNTDPVDGNYTTGDTFEVEYEVNNTGNAYAEQYIYLGADLDGNGSLDLADYQRVSLYPGDENTTLDLQFQVETGLNDDLNARVIPQTGDAGSVGFQYIDQPEFNITNLDGDGTTSPGDQYTVTATIENNGSRETQTVTLSDPSGTVVDVAQVTLGPSNPSTDVDFNWNVPLDASLGSGADLTVKTFDDTDTITVEREPAALVENVDTTVDNSADRVTVTADIRNPSNTDFNNANVEIEPGDLDRSAGGPSDKTVTIPGKSTKTVTFDWVISPGDDITDWATVKTANDSGKDVGVVQRAGNVPCTNVSYDGGDGSTSDPYEISNVDQLQCVDQDVDENYELVDDIAAHGTEHWNGGDGFEPIAEPKPENANTQFSGTFDGQGHEIHGLTIDRYGESHVGLFSRTYLSGTQNPVGQGSLIENVRLVDVDVRGKKRVGGLMGQAGGTVKKSSVSGTVEAKYQQVGGLIGHSSDADLRNQLVSTADVEGGVPSSGGSTNVGIGGLLGGTGYQTQISVGYATGNVSGNSAVGGVVGWTSDYPSPLRQMYGVGENVRRVGTDTGLSNVGRSDSAPRTAGGVVGRLESGGDILRDSVYALDTIENVGEKTDGTDNTIELPKTEMKGPQVLPANRSDSFYDKYPGVDREDAEGTMENLNWSIWTPVYDVDKDGNIVNEGLPVFQWQVDGEFIVTIESADDVRPGANNTDVVVNVKNTASYRQEQPVTLKNPDGTVVDSQRVDLGAGKETDITLTWATTFRDEVSNTSVEDLIVSSQDTVDTEDITVLPTSTNVITMDSFATNDTVRANTGTLEVVVEVSSTDPNGLDGESLVLRADGKLVDIDDSLGGDSHQTTLTWEPRTNDVGSAEVSAQILNSGVGQSADVQVLRPVRPVLVDDGVPISVDFDTIVAD